MISFFEKHINIDCTTFITVYSYFRLIINSPMKFFLLSLLNNAQKMTLVSSKDHMKFHDSDELDEWYFSK